RIDTVLLDRFGDLGKRNGTLIGQGAQGGQYDEMPIDLEVFSQLVTEVGTAITIGAQHSVFAALGNELANLVGIRLDVVGGCHDGAGGIGQQFRDIRHLLFALWVQQIVALAVEAFATQLGKAGDAPDIGADAPILFQQFFGLDHFTQNGAGAHQLHALLALAGLQQPVHTANDAFLVAFAQARMGIVLVHHRDVVIDVLLVLHHATQAVVNDHGKLVRERGVVRHAIGNQARHDVAVTILVLKAFAVQCR